MDAAFLKRFIRHHAKQAYDEVAQEYLFRLPVFVCDALRMEGDSQGLFIPKDLEYKINERFVTADCFGNEYPLLSPILDRLPAGWTRSEQAPWLLKRGAKQYALDFDIVGFIAHFLLNLDDKPSDKYDAHGRQLFESNSLVKLGLQHTPLLNIAMFSLLAVAKGWATGADSHDPREHVRPPILLLSHDCDLLRGNDFYTQMIRLYRFAKGAAVLKKGSFKHMKFFFLNIFKPLRFYYDDALYLKKIEHKYGFRSVFYLLNGRGGRFGARSGNSMIAPFVKDLGDDVEVGVHYNYKHSQTKDLLQSQLEQLRHIAKRPYESGRAHYLAFDSASSFDEILKCGIRFDESVGFSEHNAFRVGYAGAYVINESKEGGTLYELPLIFMDANTITKKHEKEVFEMLSKVEAVGGVISFLFHPGLATNQEFGEFAGIYEKYLAYFSKKHYRSTLPRDMVALLDEVNFDS